MPSHSTSRRPAQKLLDKFDAKQVGDDNVRSYLQKGFSLAICCVKCPRLIEWTPPELQEKFSGKLDVRIKDCDEVMLHRP